MAQGNDKDPFTPGAATPQTGGGGNSYGNEPPQVAVTVTRAGTIKGAIFTWVFFFGAVVACGFASAAYAPMRAFEVVLLVLLVTAPLTILAVRLLWQSFPSVAQALSSRSRRKSGKPPNLWVLKIYLLIPVAALLYSGVIAINGACDHSPLTPYTLTVKDKSYSTSKNGNRHYYAAVDSPAKPLLPFGFDNTEHIPVDSVFYKKIEPGVTQVALDTHDGYFGIPWLAGHKFIGPYTDGDGGLATTAATQQQPAAVAPDEPDWAMLTEFDRTLDATPPDAMNREYWPNGYPKQNEPMLRGELNGIGQYWFDNGKLYGEIPWNHGKKHGKFKLYRPDGTLDQVLSYKNGQPHGILEWYNRDGSLQQSWVYVDGVARKKLK